MKTLIQATLIFLVVVIPAGISAKTVTKTLKFSFKQRGNLVKKIDDDDYEPVKIKKFDYKCAVNIMDVIDDRRNKETIGYRLSGPLLGNGIREWVKSGFNHLNQYGLKIISSATGPSEKTILIRPRLYCLYAWPANLALNGMVAVKVDYELPDGNKKTFRYRGYGTRTNWVDHTGEYGNVMNKGLNRILDSVAEDLKLMC